VTAGQSYNSQQQPAVLYCLFTSTASPASSAVKLAAGLPLSVVASPVHPTIQILHHAAAGPLLTSSVVTSVASPPYNS